MAEEFVVYSLCALCEIVGRAAAIAIMPRKIQKSEEHPHWKPNWISRLFFLWMYPIIVEGWKNPKRLYGSGGRSGRITLGEGDSARKLTAQLADAWGHQVNSRSRPSLVAALASVFGLRYWLLGLTPFVEECVIGLGQPIVLGYLLQYFKGGKYGEREGWLFAAGVVLLSIWYALQHHPLFYAMQRNGMRIRVALSGLVFKKALRLPSNEHLSSGKLTNIIGSDVARLDLSKDFMHYIWIAPVQFVLVTVILWGHFGWVSLGGMILLLAFIPIQVANGRYVGKYRGRVSTATDERLKSVEESLSGIFTIKMSGWEGLFEKKVGDKRRVEAGLMMKLGVLRAVNQTLYYVVTKIALFAIFLTYVLLDKSLTPEKVFVAAALLNNVRMTLTLFLPYGIAQFAEVVVAIRRIQDFLCLPELPLLEAAADNTKGNENAATEDLIVTANNLTAKWGDQEVLNNVSFSLKRGEWLGVVGDVGTGKSSLLLAVLREMPIESGELVVSGRISYASQTPWIFSGTIRENILFGVEPDAVRYSKVIKDCCLEGDFSQMPLGDQTYVRDGRALSGGQQARIGLARALYSQPEILLLDDVLAAVDVNVGGRILQAIEAYRDKCITIFATNQLHHLAKSTSVIQLGLGPRRVLFFGTIKEFLHQQHEGDGSDRKQSESGQEGGAAVERAEATEQAEDEGSTNHDETACGKDTEENNEMTPKEIGVGVYWNYFIQGGSWVVLLLLLISNVGAQLFFTGSDYWLKYWSSSVAATNNASAEVPPSDVGGLDGLLQQLNSSRSSQILFYCGLMGALVIFSFLRTTLFFVTCVKASRALHQKMIHSLLHTRLLFFQNNSTGRIMNRFSKDISTMDETLPIVLFDSVEVGLQVLGVLIVTSILNYYLIIPAICVCIGFYYIRKVYIRSAQIFKRMEGAARSPVLSHLNQSIAGLSVIRSSHSQSLVESKFFGYLDSHSTTWYVFLGGARWLGVTVDWLSILYISAVVGVVMGFSFSEGDAGLAISAAMSLLGIMQWGVKQSSEAATQMVSVERVLEYSVLLPEEEEVVDGGALKPPEHWPSKGNLTFTNVSYKHSPDGPTVLKGISFRIEDGDKIAIAGRTGSGKSTLISSIFRVQELSGGEIVIDGLSHALLRLGALRSSIGYVLQSPFIFEGTVRENLDPLRSCAALEEEDAKLWRILKDTGLSESGVELDGKVEGAGRNLSSGQQQLLSLGRLMTRPFKILILDEATANIDTNTEQIIHSCIKSYFKEATVISVAHRLDTLREAQKILILSQGNILEYDSQERLLEDPNSQFNAMLSAKKVPK